MTMVGTYTGGGALMRPSRSALSIARWPRQVAKCHVSCLVPRQGAWQDEREGHSGVRDARPLGRDSAVHEGFAGMRHKHPEGARPKGLGTDPPGQVAMAGLVAAHISTHL